MSIHYMKHIVPLGKNRYVTLDSYSVSHETRLENLFVTSLFVIVCALTAGSLLGVDITNPSQPQIHGQSRY
jgi:hypothetical protein